MGKAIGIKFSAHIAFGVGLYFVAKRVEMRGDLAPLLPSGFSGQRFFLHSFAFVLMAAALILFVRALFSLRDLPWREALPKPAPDAPEAIAYPKIEQFDPDQVIARYLDEKAGVSTFTPDAQTAPTNDTVPPLRPSGGFGRKIG